MTFDLPDEHNHRGGILVGDVDAGGGVRGAGATRHEAYARPPGRLADGFGHHGGGALLPAHGDGDGPVVEGVEHAEEAFARHHEDVLDPVQDQLIDQGLGGGPALEGGVHGRLGCCGVRDTP